MPAQRGFNVSSDRSPQSRRPGHQPDRHRSRCQPLLSARLRHDAADRAPGGWASNFADVGLLAGIFYGVSGLSQTAAGFAVDRFGARPILAGGLAVIGCALALISVAHSFVAFAAIAVIAGLGNSVFHPADFALLNSSVNQHRLGRAFSIHGVGGSLGWAAAPVMYFLDSMFGWVGAALIGAMPGLILSVLVWTHRTDLVDHRVKVRAAAAQHGATPDADALPAAGDPALPRLLRAARGQHRRHPAVRRAGLDQHVRRQRELRGALPDRLHRRLGGRRAGGRHLRRPGAPPRPRRDARLAGGRRAHRADRRPGRLAGCCCCRCWRWPARPAASPIRRAT